MYYSAPVTDYFDKFIAKPKNCVTSSHTFIEIGGICDWRGDSSLRYVHYGIPDSPDDQTSLYNFTDIVPGSRLSNQFENVSVCLAFTV